MSYGRAHAAIAHVGADACGSAWVLAGYASIVGEAMLVEELTCVEGIETDEQNTIWSIGEGKVTTATLLNYFNHIDKRGAPKSLLLGQQRQMDITLHSTARELYSFHSRGSTVYMGYLGHQEKRQTGSRRRGGERQLDEREGGTRHEGQFRQTRDNANCSNWRSWTRHRIKSRTTGGGDGRVLR